MSARQGGDGGMARRRRAGLLRRAAAALGMAALVGVLAGALVVAGAGPASASDAEDRITRYAMTIMMDEDGVAHVSLDLTVDFGYYPNHGPYLSWVVKERYDDELDRVYRITRFRAQSPTAPDSWHTEERSGRHVAETAYLIGDEDITITGEHTYRVTFDVEGWVNPAGYPFPLGELENDELYVDVLTHWDIPVEDVTIAVYAPVPALDTACYTDGSTTCSSSHDRASATFRTDLVRPGRPLTIAVAYPAGTFGGAEPVLQERWAFSRAFAATPATVAGGLLVAAGGGLLLYRRLRRTGWDEEYADLPPGLPPAPGQQVRTRPRRTVPVAVRFSPPEGFRPGQIGTLVDEKADPHDVTATIVDLAVRQHLRIVQVPRPGAKEPDWRLDRSTKPHSDLLPFESMLIAQLFSGRWSVHLSELRTTFAAAMAMIQAELYRDVTDRGWFRGDPRQARARWALASVWLLILSLGVTVLVAARTHWGLVAAPLVPLAVVALCLTKAAPARTAAGSAVLAQAQGFRLYLATAEAEQLRFEEGEDLFSRYLPYAIAFGLTERWANLFAQLAAQGRALPEPTWLVGPYTGHAPFWAATAGTLGRDLSSFASTATSALSAPAPGTSGGSGFGGGGGGGGVGGGGGGTW